MTTSYRTIEHKSTGEYKEKGSKFIGYALPVITEIEIKEELKKLKSEHPKARHHCYAYRLGYDGTQFRANDDGEPSGTGGKPILGRIDSFGLTNLVVVVVRYFGGILLGSAGLTKAYKSAANEALANATIVEKEISDRYEINFSYSVLPEIMNLIKNLKIETGAKAIAEYCNFTIDVPRIKLSELSTQLNRMNIELKKAG